MKIQMQNADKIFFSKSYAKYKSKVTHFTSRKSTAIEWMILELIKRYSTNNEYGSNISIKTIVEDMLFVPDTDILVKPSIIELVKINAIEDKNNKIDENISLNSVSLSELSLTKSGKELQERGLIPGKEAEDEVVFIYDKLENDLKLEAESKIDLKKEHKGIELSDDYNFTFDENKAKKILEDMKNKGKFRWLQPTSEIKSIDKDEPEILWRDLNCEIDIDESGKLQLINYKNKEIFNKLLINKIDKLFKLDNIELKEIKTFDYNYYKNLLNIFSAEAISDKLKNILNNKDFVIVNDSFNELIDYQTINTNLLLIYGKDDFDIDIKDKNIIVDINENMPLNNCIALNKDKTNLCIANFEVYNDFGKNNIILGYSYSYKDNFVSLEHELIDKYRHYDARIILLNLFISKDINIFKNNIIKHFNEIEEIDDALNFLSNIIEETKKLKLNRNDAENMLVNIISENNKAQKIDNIKKLEEYLKIVCNKEILDKDSLNKVYVNIIKDNEIYIDNVKDLESFYNMLKKYQIPFKDIESVIKNIYKNSFIDMIIKYMNDTAYRYEELSLAEKIINSFANNIKSLSQNLKLKESDLFKIISPSELSKKIIEFYRNSNNKDALLNDINNIDKIINEISSRFGIEEEALKQNNMINDTLSNIEEMRPTIYKFNDKSINNFDKIYVVDTNVLINEPKIFDYLDNKSLMVIPKVVIEELDNVKLDKNKSEKEKYNAREAHRNIINILDSKKPNIRLEDSDKELFSHDFSKSKKDNLILSVALKFIVKDVYLLTVDKNPQIKAMGEKIKYINLEDFKNLKNNNQNKKK